MTPSPVTIVTIKNAYITTEQKELPLVKEKKQKEALENLSRKVAHGGIIRRPRGRSNLVRIPISITNFPDSDKIDSRSQKDKGSELSKRSPGASHSRDWVRKLKTAEVAWSKYWVQQNQNDGELSARKRRNLAMKKQIQTINNDWVVESEGTSESQLESPIHYGRAGFSKLTGAKRPWDTYRRTVRSLRGGLADTYVPPIIEGLLNADDSIEEADDEEEDEDEKGVDHRPVTRLMTGMRKKRYLDSQSDETDDIIDSSEDSQSRSREKRRVSRPSLMMIRNTPTLVSSATLDSRQQQFQSKSVTPGPSPETEFVVTKKFKLPNRLTYPDNDSSTPSPSPDKLTFPALASKLTPSVTTRSIRLTYTYSWSSSSSSSSVSSPSNPTRIVKKAMKSPKTSSPRNLYKHEGIVNLVADDTIISSCKQLRQKDESSRSNSQKSKKRPASKAGISTSTPTPKSTTRTAYIYNPTDTNPLTFSRGQPLHLKHTKTSGSPYSTTPSAIAMASGVLPTHLHHIPIDWEAVRQSSMHRSLTNPFAGPIPKLVTRNLLQLHIPPSTWYGAASGPKKGVTLAPDQYSVKDSSGSVSSRTANTAAVSNASIPPKGSVSCNKRKFGNVRLTQNKIWAHVQRRAGLAGLVNQKGYPVKVPVYSVNELERQTQERRPDTLYGRVENNLCSLGTTTSHILPIARNIATGAYKITKYIWPFNNAGALKAAQAKCLSDALDHESFESSFIYVPGTLTSESARLTTDTIGPFALQPSRLAPPGSVAATPNYWSQRAPVAASLQYEMPSSVCESQESTRTSSPSSDTFDSLNTHAAVAVSPFAALTPLDTPESLKKPIAPVSPGGMLLGNIPSAHLLPSLPLDTLITFPQTFRSLSKGKTSHPSHPAIKTNTPCLVAPSSFEELALHTRACARRFYNGRPGNLAAAHAYIAVPSETTRGFGSRFDPVYRRHLHGTRQTVAGITTRCFDGTEILKRASGVIRKRAGGFDGKVVGRVQEFLGRREVQDALVGVGVFLGAAVVMRCIGFPGVVEEIGGPKVVSYELKPEVRIWSIGIN